MQRVAILENEKVINLINAPHGWKDPVGREVIEAPRGSKIEIGCVRQPDGSFVSPAFTEEEVRSKRDSLLKESDWTQLPDAPVDQTAWATYRQELRDITQQEGFPENVTWPTKPE